MKITVVFTLALAVVTPALGFNGSIESIGDIRVLNLWGTWEEMGYAHGYLLGPDMVDFYEGYFLELVGGIGNVNVLRSYFDMYFTVPDEFTEYADGIITGVADTIPLWSSVYNREIDALDLYIVSSVPDLSAVVDFKQLLCSSVSSWGDATFDDAILQGDPAISRNLDYYVDYDETILDHSLLIVHDPDSGQDWVSVSFPGFMGSLSGMNETGITFALNMGNYSGTSQTSPKFVPISMALALGLSEDDFDQSGTCDIQDLMAASTQWNVANTYDIHINSPASLGTGGNPAAITEVNNHRGSVFRYASDEPAIAPDRLILTNHHRVLYHPVSCNRYSRLLDSLITNPDVTLDRLWNFMGAVGGVPQPGVGGTIQTMIFQPEQRRIGLAFSTTVTASFNKTPQWIQWSDIYPNHDPQSVQEGTTSQVALNACPNPASSVLYVTAEVSAADLLQLFDLKGRQMNVCFSQTAMGQFSVDISSLGSGLYLVVNSSSECLESASVLIFR